MMTAAARRRAHRPQFAGIARVDMELQVFARFYGLQQLLWTTWTRGFPRPVRDHETGAAGRDSRRPRRKTRNGEQVLANRHSRPTNMAFVAPSYANKGCEFSGEANKLTPRTNTGERTFSAAEPERCRCKPKKQRFRNHPDHATPLKLGLHRDRAPMASSTGARGNRT